MREALWAYPAVEAIHILALALVVGSIVIVDLRLLGLSRDVPASRLSRLALPFTGAPSSWRCSPGSSCSPRTPRTSSPTACSRSRWVSSCSRASTPGSCTPVRGGRSRNGTRARRRQASVRVAALISIVIWIAVVACGRLLAYT
jgi:hypothetical protein